APQNSSYGNIGCAATAYGVSYAHAENVAPSRGVPTGHFENVASGFGVPQAWRSSPFANTAPTYQETHLHCGELMDHNMIHVGK
ncbi:hypothetical protein MKX01_014967, partial [Papaver californicum]